MGRTVLIVGAIGYFVAFGIFIAYFTVRLLDIVDVEVVGFSFSLSALILVVASLAAFTVFLVKCPHCTERIFKPPWKRNPDEGLRVNKMAQILLGGDVNCMSCGEKFKDSV